MSRSSPILLLFLVFLALLHNAWYARQLPTVVASHFDCAGNANGWMSRQAFCLLYAGLVILMAGIFLLAGRLLDWVPDRLVNLPNKAYWLDPSRREETYAYFRQWACRSGSVVIAFLAVVMHLVIRVNLGQDRTLHAFTPWLIGTFALLMGAQAISLVARFRNVPQEPGRK